MLDQHNLLSRHRCHDDDYGAYLPSQEEIEKATKLIRENWTESERIRRRYLCPNDLRKVMDISPEHFAEEPIRIYSFEGLSYYA